MKSFSPFLLFVTLLLVGCSPVKTTKVDLKQLYPLASPEIQDVTPLRVAVAAVISPQGTVESYDGLLKYMSQRLGRPIELEQRASYAETNQLVEMGQVDFAFVCTGAYISGTRDFGMEILVAPEVNGKAAYHSWLIVPTNSAANSIDDLRGKTFAFTDPLSLTGRIYPTYLVQQLWETPEVFFGRVFFTYSHDAAIEAVAEGLADGAAVDHLIYLHLLERNPDLERKLKVIHRSPPFGIPPVVVSSSIRPQLKSDILDLFLNMDKDPEGRAALQAIGVDRFILIEDSAYDMVRELESETGYLEEQP
jgi:phosphonate transport system substrate-binding protein